MPPESEAAGNVGLDMSSQSRSRNIRFYVQGQVVRDLGILQEESSLLQLDVNAPNGDAMDGTNEGSGVSDGVAVDSLALATGLLPPGIEFSEENEAGNSEFYHGSGSAGVSHERGAGANGSIGNSGADGSEQL